MAPIPSPSTRGARTPPSAGPHQEDGADASKPLRVVVLAGGVGGARFLRGLRNHLDTTPGLQASTVTVVVNTGDDITLHGLRVCPDLDTVMYTVAGVVDDGRGWGRSTESHVLSHELVAYGVQPRWFSLGDRDLGTHLARTQWLAEHLSLSEVTARLSARWNLADQGVTLLPMSDEPAETRVLARREDGMPVNMHFQEWWVRHGASLEVRAFDFGGARRPMPAPGVLEAIQGADVVLLPPSNPVVSIGTILRVEGLRDAIRTASAPVVGVSPLISGRPVRGHADACLRAVGAEVSAAGVARLYEDVLDGWLVDPQDARTTAGRARVEAFNGPLLMTDVVASSRIAAHALDLSRRLNASRTGNPASQSHRLSS